VVTTRSHDNSGVFYTGVEAGDKLFSGVWPAPDFDDVYIEKTGDHGEVLIGEPRRSSCWRWLMGVPDEPGFVFRLVPWRWLPPCRAEHVAKGVRDVRDALAKQDKPVVLYGASRGAGLVFLVAEALTPEERARVHMAVAEAPFDSTWNVLLDRLLTSKCFPIPAWLVEMIRPLGHWLPLIPRSPIDVDVPHDVPLIMASGTEDASCMFTGQQRLARKLRAQNHPDFTHVVIEGAHHNNIWQATEFIQAVRARLP